MRRVFSILMFLTCFLELARAQERRFFRSWTTRDGMPSNSLCDVGFDANGFMWLATELGLTRFDGVSIKKFRLQGKSDGPLSHDRMAYVFAEGRRDVFAANANGELFRLDEARDSFYSVAQIWSLNKSQRKLAKFPVALGDLKNERILVADERFGLVAFSTKTSQMDTLLERRFKHCRQITVDSAGAIWVSDAFGLFRFGADGQKSVHFSGRNFGGGVADRDGIWFVEIGKAIHRFDQKTGIFSSKPLDYGTVKFDPKNDFVVETMDEKGLIWAYSSTDGVLLIDPERGAAVQNFEQSRDAGDGFSSNIVYSIKQHEGDIWLCTWNGLLRTSASKQFFLHKKINAPENTPFFRVRQRLADPDRAGIEWLVTNNLGLVCVEDQTGKIVRNVMADGFDADQWNRLSHAIIGADGRFFCGSMGGLFIADPRKKTVEKRVVRSPNFGEKNQSVADCWFADDGAFWIQTYLEIGPFDLKTGIFSPILLDAAHSSNQILSVRKGQKNRIWVASYEGGFEVSTAEKRIVKFLKDGDRPMQVQSIAEDSFFVWLATFKGLSRFEKKTELVKNYGLEQGLGDLTIKSLLLDGRGKLWMNTQDGIYLFDPPTEKFIRFSQKDGLPENNLPGILTEDDGIFCAGFDKSYIVFRPFAEVDRRARPPVLTDFFVLGKRRHIVSGQKMQLLFSENVLEFAFSCPDFDGGDRIQFERQLVGFDPRPVANGTERKATYTNLDAGSYRLNIWAINPDGFRCAEPAVFDFEVLPPFYETWWFRSLVAAFLAFSMWAIIHFRLRQRIEKEKIRLQIARDLHDDVGSTLSTISILSGSAMLQTDQNLAQKRLTTISEKSREALFGISDIVWAVNPENDRMQKVIERMALFATETVENAGIALVFKADEALFSIKMDMTARRDFYLFFKEAVANAARHSGASRIEIHFSKTEKGFALQILDNGKGFDPTKIDSRFGGNGLRNLRARADALGGHFSISSAAGKGCSVDLQAPPVS